MSCKEDGCQKPGICHVTVHQMFDARIFHRQCCQLVEQGYGVHLVVPFEESSMIDGVHVHGYKSSKNRPVRILIKPWVAFSRALKTGAKVFHCHDPELLPLALLVKIFTRSVVIFDVHEDYVNYMKQKHYLNSVVSGIFSVMMKFLLWMCCVFLDGFVFADEGTSKSYRAISEKRKCIIHNYPLLSIFPKPKHEWQSRRYDVGFVGTMSRTSGTYVMIKAVKRVREKIQDLKCIFIGSLQEDVKEDIEAYIRENKLEDCVEITGRIPHKTIPPLLGECKIGLIGLLNMPKFQVNIATKMFEYMASATPVVSADLPPERRFIVEEKHGYLVTCEDDRAMGEAICKILSDPDLGHEMSQNCRKDLLENGYYAEHEINRLDEFYGFLIANRKRILFL